MSEFQVKVIPAMTIPQEYDANFLASMAKKLKLSPIGHKIFTQRLCHNQQEAKWSEILNSLDYRIAEDQARKNYWNKEIIPKLKKQCGFEYQEGTKKLWIKARQWLAQTQFEPWLWEQLIQKSQPTQQMGVKDPHGGEHLGMRPKPKNDYLDKVPLYKEVVFEIQLPQAGHLTLLEREPNGTVACLCPSQWAPKSQFSQATKVIWPQPNNQRQVFQPNELGTEQLLALLTRESPGFDWLEKSRKEEMELQASHLQQMFEYVKQQPNARLLYTQYEVV